MYTKEMTVSLSSKRHDARGHHAPKRLMSSSERIDRFFTLSKREERLLYAGLIIGVMLAAAIGLAFINWMSIEYGEEVNGLSMRNRFLNSRLETVTGEYTAQIEQQREEYDLRIDELERELESYEEEMASVNMQLEEESSLTFSLIRKYKYIIDGVDTSNGFTWDMLVYLDAQCKEYNLNPHMVTAIITKESHFDVDAQNQTSSARGLGQTLASTAKTVYENMLGNGNGSYSHAMADNGYTNISIVCRYLKYLKDNYDSVNAMINAYSGDQSGSYYSGWVSIMRSYGQDPSINHYV